MPKLRGHTTTVPDEVEDYQWIVWIDDNMGRGKPNWEIDNPGENPAESLASAVLHATLAAQSGYLVAILPTASLSLTASNPCARRHHWQQAHLVALYEHSHENQLETHY